MGIIIALTVIIFWAFHLVFMLEFLPTEFHSFWMYFHILVQGYLYTGLFITSHDAMHGTISQNKQINNLIGKISAFLFAALSYKKLKVNHKLHHKYPGTENDPDFNVHSQNFFLWWLSFLFRYATIIQIITMGLIFNLLKIRYSEISIWLYLVIPSFLGSLQLFYFGTYLQHRIPHTDLMKPHNARTQKKNHFWAMISCYFFGYHFEHHDSPHIPWWKLFQVKKNEL